jgi:hypothetical protein
VQVVVVRALVQLGAIKELRMAALHKTDEAVRGEGDGWDSHLHPEPFERESPSQLFSLYVGASVNS